VSVKISAPPCANGTWGLQTATRTPRYRAGFASDAGIFTERSGIAAF
jgi:hypothetical protein